MKWILYRSAWYEPQSGDNNLLVGIKAGRWKMGRCTLPWLTANSEVRSRAARRSDKTCNAKPSPLSHHRHFGGIASLRWASADSPDFKNARGSESFLKVVQLSNFHRRVLMHSLVELRVHQVENIQESHLLSNPWLTLGFVLANYLHIKHKNHCGSENESYNYYQ